MDEARAKQLAVELVTQVASFVKEINSTKEEIEDDLPIEEKLARVERFVATAVHLYAAARYVGRIGEEVWKIAGGGNAAFDAMRVTMDEAVENDVRRSLAG